MSRCCMVSCLNKRSEKKVKFFNFPSDTATCLQWVEFCRCPDTLKRFEEGGAVALRKFAICSEHFEPALVEAAGKKQLPPDAIPINIGRTYMTPAMLLEKGFNIEVFVDNETEHELILDATHIPDAVLVEMLCPEDIKEESDKDETENAVNPIDIEETQRAEKTSDYPTTESIHTALPSNLNRSSIGDAPSVSNTVINCKRLCMATSTFKNRYEIQKVKNQQLRDSIQKSKKKYAKMTAEVQKMVDTVALKRQKRTKLNERYIELKKLCKKGVPLSNSMEVDESNDEPDFDESTAWW
ncbi:uncharacterized protein LOC131679208 [Topomyia yanbarensis]|uniref:uncharacterized protein LOC131679208 n=1 Tax=Topomyia yanbarensis TaxID=2498891 RepID=UPI00273C9559|nr:uncharacterized protein LOC131679208 [Topomyia yanbarensis]